MQRLVFDKHTHTQMPVILHFTHFDLIVFLPKSLINIQLGDFGK